jgi:hypothetical protein
MTTAEKIAAKCDAKEALAEAGDAAGATWMTIEQQWLQTCESFAQATPREWSANDERLYRSGLTLLAAVRAEERQRLKTALHNDL